MTIPEKRERIGVKLAFKQELEEDQDIHS